jgi:hypothetical protein
MMTIIEFIYDRKYPVAIAADGGSMKFPPNVFEQAVSDYEKYKSEAMTTNKRLVKQYKKQ